MASWENRQFNVAGGEEPVQVPGMRVSASLFPMLCARPQLGRTFTADEDAPGHDVVVLGDEVWRTRFGGRPDIVGQTMRVNGRPHEVIGVMSPSFVFMQRRQQVWVPIAFNTEADVERGSHSFLVAARLKDGVTFDAAIVKSPSFSRDSSSTTTTMRPERIASTASSMVANGPRRAPLAMRSVVSLGVMM
jgi:putative ABC transport system permease protein